MTERVNNHDEMLDIKRATGCGHLEYYGALHWLSGLTYCRSCMYTEWEKSGRWKRDPRKDFIYPQYFDGIAYAKMKGEYQE